jgi:hypothetical protein
MCFALADKSTLERHLVNVIDFKKKLGQYYIVQHWGSIPWRPKKAKRQLNVSIVQL